ncbi:MAG: hypothetical protein M3Y73_13055 [Actinomycetota bacterium]|nr:hypothetical protein [Actinomycetota bacterium]
MTDEVIGGQREGAGAAGSLALPTAFSMLATPSWNAGFAKTSAEARANR